jgi:hypothetical protein
MAEIRTRDGSLYVYTHWYGYALPQLAQQAVAKAAPRLGDEPYWTRIVVDQLTKSARDQETGFGLMLRPSAEDEYNHDQPSVIIDSRDGSVKVVVGGGKGINDTDGEEDDQ